MLAARLMAGACGGAGGGATIPYTTNLLAWYDASDESSIDDSTDAGRAQQWNDLSGNGNHLTATGTARPYTGSRTKNSLNVLDFQGGQYMQDTLSSAVSMGGCSVFMAMIHDSDPGTFVGFMSIHSGGVTSDWNNNNSFTFEGSNGSFLFSITSNSASVQQSGGGGYAGGLWNVTDFTKTSAASGLSHKQTYSGTTQTTTGTLSSSGSSSNLIIGARFQAGVNNYSDIAIGEIAIYSAVVGTSDRDAVRDYLLSKWGIAGP